MFILFAVLSVIGGFIEASNHSHTVYNTDLFGTRTWSSANDWNYAVAGGVGAMIWLAVAGVCALIRGIARDLRVIAEAGNLTPGKTSSV